MKAFIGATIWLLAALREVGAFQSPRFLNQRTDTKVPLFLVDKESSSFPSSHENKVVTSSRRQWAVDALSRGSAITVATAASWPLLVPPTPSWASGGATAGGAYLLSAKQRYNERVKEGVKGFVALRKYVEAGDVDGIRPYFANEDVGSWKDLSTAGYLLANAFRRNSTAAPDSLPAVQKWKAYAAKVEAMIKAFKKKDVTSAQAAYRGALEALDEYLDKVELPGAASL